MEGVNQVLKTLYMHETLLCSFQPCGIGLAVPCQAPMLMFKVHWQCTAESAVPSGGSCKAAD
jgi:hypothetical protein